MELDELFKIFGVGINIDILLVVIFLLVVFAIELTIFYKIKKSKDVKEEQHLQPDTSMDAATAIETSSNRLLSNAIPAEPDIQQLLKRILADELLTECYNTIINSQSEISTVSQLATALSIDRSWLYKKIYKELQISPKEFITILQTELRVDSPKRAEI